MELRHLKYFTAAAEELNISKAARRLHVSQPAVSRLIHDLEDELGAALFTRGPQGLTLTEAGAKFFSYARQILDLSNEAIQVVSSAKDTDMVITIGFFASSLGPLLSEALKVFRVANPETAIRFNELSPADQVKGLRKKQIDLALIGHSCGAVHDEFETRVLFELRQEAVIPATHHLAKRKRIRLKELEQDAFIGYREESFPGRNQAIINACNLSGFKPDLRYQIDSLAEALAMIGSGVGVCLLPADVVNLPHPGAQFVAIQEKVEPIRFTAAWRRDDDRPIIKNLVEYAQQRYSGGE